MNYAPSTRPTGPPSAVASASSAPATAANGAAHTTIGRIRRLAAKSILTVAHLDHNPANNADDNLAALCQACHNRYDAQNRKHNALRDAGQMPLI